ncbi:MAG: peptide chain release factor N(5)-glutamine methyltransferase [Dehalococcoidaceae bacterium]|nr:peptide chain release factor N(5)-glutamine methyltransferase [Dehalococcoidaceae bacterium]
MKIVDALKESEHQLTFTRTDAPLLESEVLLRHILNISRAQLYMSLHDAITQQDWQSLQCMVERRLAGEPVAYIISKKEFYNLELFVDKRVLIPRPETEILVEEALNIAQGIESPVICDLGTGSGAIAIAIAHNNPAAELLAIDSNPECLDVAAINIHALGLDGRIILLHGNLLEPLEKTTDIICANLPYVKHSDIDNNTFEPVNSLDGGINGLDVIQILIKDYYRYLNPGGRLLIEIGDGQEAAVKTFLGRYTPSVAVLSRRDLSGIVRMIIASRT